MKADQTKAVEIIRDRIHGVASPVTEAALRIERAVARLEKGT
jgi:hypothetical protein